MIFLGLRLRSCSSRLQKPLCRHASGAPFWAFDNLTSRSRSGRFGSARLASSTILLSGWTRARWPRASCGGHMASDDAETERRLRSVADQLRANSGLKPSEYSRPVLDLLFLRYADGCFAEAEKQLKSRPSSPPRRANTGRFQGAGRRLSDASVRGAHGVRPGVERGRAASPPRGADRRGTGSLRHPHPSEPRPTKAEEMNVKIARSLLAKLEREELIIDWRLCEAEKADV